MIKRTIISGIMACLLLAAPHTQAASISSLSKSFDRFATGCLKLSAASMLTAITVSTVFCAYQGYRLLSAHMTTTNDNKKLVELNQKQMDIEERIKTLQEENARLIQNAEEQNRMLNSLEQQGNNNTSTVLNELRKLQDELKETKDMQAAIIETSNKKDAIFDVLKRTGSSALGWLQSKLNPMKLFA